MENFKKIIQNKFEIDNLFGIERTDYNFIRLDLENINNKEILLKSILSNILSDNVLIGMYLYGKEKNISIEDLNSLEKRGIYKYMKNFSIYNCFLDDIWNNLIIFKNKDNVTKNINKALLEKDFSIEPYLFLNAYYFDIDNEIIFNLYDDRGFDILSINKKVLKNVEEQLDNMNLNFNKFY